jgi:hypothetical protein
MLQRGASLQAGYPDLAPDSGASPRSPVPGPTMDKAPLIAAVRSRGLSVQHSCEVNEAEQAAGVKTVAGRPANLVLVCACDPHMQHEKLGSITSGLLHSM